MKNRMMLTEFWDFIKTNKKWWLLPIIFMIILFSIFIIIGQGSMSGGVSPFIYALF